MRRLALVLAASVLALVLLLGSPAIAAAQEDEPAPTAELPIGDIVPKPNSGDEPTDSGDRGGSLQLLLFGGIVAVLVIGAVRIGVLVVRGDRRRSPGAGPDPEG